MESCLLSLPYQSVNFLTAHDGFCLYDLVAYNHRHNEANGHNNTDGCENNVSWNCGWEGDENTSADVICPPLEQDLTPSFTPACHGPPDVWPVSA